MSLLKVSFNENMFSNGNNRLILLSFIFLITIIGFLHELQSGVYSNFLKETFYVQNIHLNSSGEKFHLRKLTEIVQQRIHGLQFPWHCKKIKLLRCGVRFTSGFGSQMGLRTLCLIAAFTTGRTWIPYANSPGSPALGWEGYFLPITNCSESSIENTTDVVYVDAFRYKSPLMPPAFPSEFTEVLLKYHSYPPSYWVGIFQSYLMRYQPFLEKYINQKVTEIEFQEPVVGIHVRRGDKLRHDAYRFELHDYMTHAISWFNNTHKTRQQQRIYLLTDDRTIFGDAVRKYPDVHFIYDDKFSSRTKLSNIDAKPLLDIITGVDILSRCNYVVCTFSSNVCKLAFELAQMRRYDDSTNRFVSLDGLWYFWDRQVRYQIATEHHSSNGDLQMYAGDLIVVDDNPWLRPYTGIALNIRTNKNLFDGKIEGQNLRTGQFGRYPISKVREKWQTY